MKKLVLLSMLLFGYLTIWGQSADENKEDVFISDPTIMPAYPGGESEMYKFINERLFYPWAGDSIKGRVIVRFRVDTLGDLRDVMVLRGINPIADSISVSIVRQMPRWSIGTRYGKPLDILFTLPIVFDPVKIPAEKKKSQSEVLPDFPGGPAAMYQYIRRKLKIPYCGYLQTGRVLVRFIVDSEGKIWHPHIVHSTAPAFDADALQIIGSMPDWIVPEGDVGCCLYAVPVIINHH